ncbi:hypothetical protein BY996DRAFT_367481 [Phakopsora pachyrhizi]|uniref:Manganese/iron superoxide dismutase C-terminal domain-containing protein n=1 Tax=Phakopsora pachyrhizi TaxID=170000 RepID=A0AAV0BG81_PHAPC|nr:hypothetical protein BY996DRAFT_367481 [Phakopsora pachyrhizi]CAH7684892.1 hypothetical protein PPACK8108_LOCUS19329 [Phakopsora pachyrhizi]
MVKMVACYGRSIKLKSCQRLLRPNHFSFRALHISPPISSLPFSIDTGLSPFLTSKTCKILAVEWQDGLLDRLNQYVRGTSAESKTLFDTIVDLSKDRTQVLPFNLASEALNNSFFLNGLKKAAPDQSTTRPSKGSSLANAIDETYGSITQFISYFSNAAMGMSTSGYIWLVCDQDGNLGICATYGGGTILVQNREQRGDWPMAIRSSSIGLDGNGRPTPENKDGIKPDSVARTNELGISESDTNLTSNSEASEDFTKSTSTSHKEFVSFTDSLFASPTPAPKSSSNIEVNSFKSKPPLNRAITRKSANPAERFNHIHPLMNLMVAERAYLPDYGVWGKELYLRNFWKCVDWSKVENSFESRLPKSSFQYRPGSNSIWSS